MQGIAKSQVVGSIGGMWLHAPGGCSPACVTAIVHVLAPEGGTLTQHDGVPAGGSYPTTLWVPGEVVADLHLLEPTPDLTAGEYEFEIGMYVLETGQRLPVPGSPDGAIHVLFQLPPE